MKFKLFFWKREKKPTQTNRVSTHTHTHARFLCWFTSRAKQTCSQSAVGMQRQIRHRSSKPTSWQPDEHTSAFYNKLQPFELPARS